MTVKEKVLEELQKNDLKNEAYLDLNKRGHPVVPIISAFREEAIDLTETLVRAECEKEMEKERKLYVGKGYHDNEVGALRDQVEIAKDQERNRIKKGVEKKFVVNPLMPEEHFKNKILYEFLKIVDKETKG